MVMACPAEELSQNKVIPAQQIMSIEDSNHPLEAAQKLQG